MGCGQKRPIYPRPKYFSVQKRYIGFHVPIGKSISSVFETAKSMNCTTLQMFTRNPRGWKAKPLNKKDILEFKNKKRSSGFQFVVDHMPYLPNLASPISSVKKKSRDALISEVERCEKLGIDFLVLHLGSHMGKGTDAGMRNVVEACNSALKRKGRTHLLLENSAGQKNSVGSRFEELGKMISMISSKRVGICFDTCHAFASGYDIASKEGISNTMKNFENSVGLDKIKVIHLNDSKGELGSRKDRHENLGKGRIGLQGFKEFLSFDDLAEKLIILETPYKDFETVAQDLKTLNSLLNSDSSV